MARPALAKPPWTMPTTRGPDPYYATMIALDQAAAPMRSATPPREGASISLGGYQRGQARGAYMMTSIPTTAMAAPNRSNRSGACPSTSQPHSSAMAMKMPPYAA